MSDLDILKQIERKMKTKAKAYEKIDRFIKDKYTLRIMWNNTNIARLAIEKYSEKIPNEIANLNNLCELYIRSCDLKQAPIWIGKMVQLEDLNLFRNHLTTLPNEYSSLINLRNLRIGCNDFNALPTVIRNMPWILSISMFSNEKSLDIPEWVDELHNLKNFDLSFCKLSSIPYGLVKLNLPFNVETTIPKGIGLCSTTLEKGDISLFSQPRSVIEAFYAGKQETIKECKVIFLGDGGAGKSSLIERMMNNTFDKDKNPTEGVQMHSWMVDLENNESVRLRILDFGGQEIMHAMHRCFLTERTVYVIVCESRSDGDIDHTAAKWLENVRSFAENCPVILALNKCDLNQHISVNERNLKSINKNLFHVIKTSAALTKNNGIDNLVSSIKHEILKNVEYLSTFNSNWLTIKTSLENMTSHYIEDSQYRQLCSENQVSDREMQNKILDWFMDLGVAYHYHSPNLNYNLENIRVLSPAWLTNGIYRLILRTPENSGILLHKDIKSVLKANNPKDIIPDLTYTPRETEFILSVMRQFQISHDMGDGEELIPLKMDKNAPVSVDQFDTSSALHLSWEASYIPNTAIHRLMIRKFHDLDTSCMWRTGARFEDKINNREALVEMNDRRVDIYVNAKEDKRIYMEELRKHLLEILYELNLECKEVLYCTIDGQIGEIPYLDVLFQYREGKKEVYISNIRKFANPKSILFEAYTHEVINQNGVCLNVYGDGAIIQPVIGDHATVQQINNEYNVIAHKIASKDSIKQNDYDDILKQLSLITSKEHLKEGQKRKINELLAQCQGKTVHSAWHRLRDFLTDAATMTTLITAAVAYGPQLLSLLQKIFQ